MPTGEVERVGLRDVEWWTDGVIGGSGMTLEDYVEGSIAAAGKLPVGRRETPAEIGLGETYGIGPVGRHRDSGLLERTNFDVVSKDLEERFPDDVEVLRFGHWAVGWVEELAVRLREDDGRPTAAAEAARGWAEKLEDYPVADEEEWSRREDELRRDNVDDALRDFYQKHDGELLGDFFAKWEKPARQDEIIDDVWRYMDEKMRRPRGLERPEEYSIREEEVEEALLGLGLLEAEE